MKDDSLEFVQQVPNVEAEALHTCRVCGYLKECPHHVDFELEGQTVRYWLCNPCWEWCERTRAKAARAFMQKVRECSKNCKKHRK